MVSENLVSERRVPEKPIPRLDALAPPLLPATVVRTEATLPADVPAPAPMAQPAVPDQIVSAVVPLHGRGDGRHEVTLELRPDDLGTIRVEVSVENQTVHLTLHAAEPATGRLLSAALADLRSALADAGLTAGHVAVGPDGGGATGQASGVARRANRRLTVGPRPAAGPQTDHQSRPCSPHPPGRRPARPLPLAERSADEHRRCIARPRPAGARHHATRSTGPTDGATRQTDPQASREGHVPQAARGPAQVPEPHGTRRQLAVHGPDGAVHHGREAPGHGRPDRRPRRRRGVAAGRRPPRPPGRPTSTTEGAAQTGVVTGTQFGTDGPVLLLGTTEISLDDVREVALAPSPPDPQTHKERGTACSARCSRGSPASAATRR